jgi:hypothetical protein
MKEEQTILEIADVHPVFNERGEIPRWQRGDMRRCTLIAGCQIAALSFVLISEFVL